ncbi:alanine racemase C-terminal domain-containing protein [Thomasclavelia cocleata]|uniref:alanine racemase C-terminal domain-containing protein n=1 Tax=Thomasclavelia cocleata TaxID=69824 RepID=UPI0020119EEB|nr:alanine racemase C-terminal domain-containing protein [Thomasclavelia cocleata]
MPRIGILMYGIKSSHSDYLKIKLDLSPVLSIKSRIATIHHLVKGTKIGYGLTYQVTKDSIVATIPIGYGDGIPRQLSSNGYVLVKGQKCPIIGRICMDQMLVDVSRVKNLTSNEVVTIIGKDGNNEIRIEQLALAADTISNEILCRIKKRLPRIYKGGN